jgi:hypothetical protein
MITIPQLRKERIDRALAQAREAASGTGPIVVGPWLGEVGFELLYWIPFLRWLIAEAPIDPARLVVLSRGGCAHWYAGLHGTYTELFDTISPDELRVMNRERMAEQAAAGPACGLQRGQMTAKQYGVTRVEREILARVGLEGAALLHPSIMYSLLRWQWRGRIKDLYARCTRPIPMRTPAAMRGGPYVAVKFYSSMACPDRAVHTVRRLVGLIAEVMPVIVLDSGAQYDDHGSLAIDDPRVCVLADRNPSQNLAIQTSVIAHASAFVGTYGGFAYLAPLLGVPTTACYTDRTFRDDHYQVAAGLFKSWGTRFEVVELEAGLARFQRAGGGWLHAA